MRKGISALFKKGWGWRMIRLRGFKLLCYDVDFRSGFVPAPELVPCARVS